MFRSSYFWNGFVRVFIWISKALSWKVGNGKLIILGVDQIMGLDDSYVLSPELVECLHDYVMYSLNHAQNLGRGSNSNGYWLGADDLKLGGDWKEEWS